MASELTAAVLAVESYWLVGAKPNDLMHYVLEESPERISIANILHKYRDHYIGLEVQARTGDSSWIVAAWSREVENEIAEAKTRGQRHE